MKDNPLGQTQQLLASAERASAQSEMRRLLVASTTITVILVVLVGGGLLLFLKSPFGKRFLLEESGKLEASELEQERLKSSIALERAMGLSYQARLKETAADAESVIATLKARLLPLQEKWKTRLSELETSEGGRAIGADSSAFEAYLRIAEGKPPAALSAASLLPKLEGIRDTATTLAAAPILKDAPDPEMKAELEAVSRRVQDAVLEHEEALAALDAVETLARSKGNPGSTTLRDTLDSHRNRAANERAEIYKLAFEKAEEETRREIERIAAESAATIAKMKQDMAAQEAADQQEHEARMADLELATAKAKQGAIEAEAATVRSIEDQRTQAEAEKAALEALKKRALSSEVQDMLAPFITPDYFQLRDDVVTDKAPMSYKAMERFGAFAPGVPGLINLYEIALHEQNTRPKGGWAAVVGRTGHYEMSYGEASSRAYVAKVQQTLKELKPALLDLKLMRP